MKHTIERSVFFFFQMKTCFWTETYIKLDLRLKFAIPFNLLVSLSLQFFKAGLT